MPVQMLLLIPMLPMAVLVGAELNVRFEIIFKTVAVLFLMRTLAATTMVHSANRSTTPKWLVAPINAVLAIAGYACFASPMMLFVIIAESRAQVSDLGLIVTAANLIAILLFLLVALIRAGH